MAELWSIVLVVAISFVGAIAALFFKKGSADFSFSVSGLFRNKNLIIGVILYAITTVFFVFALRGGELSILYPFVATAYIWTALLSVKFLGEDMNRYKWLGIALVIIGVSIIGSA